VEKQKAVDSYLNPVCGREKSDMLCGEEKNSEAGNENKLMMLI
jgi:hypothetical protein